MSKVVEVESLVKRYGSLAAVDDVTFSVEEGEVFGVLGPYGAGKTTTVEMIEGLRKPDNGSIRVFGIDALRERGRIKELIGVQLQTTSLYDRLRRYIRPHRSLFLPGLPCRACGTPCQNSLSITMPARWVHRTISSASRSSVP